MNRAEGSAQHQLSLALGPSPAVPVRVGSTIAVQAPAGTCDAKACPGRMPTHLHDSLVKLHPSGNYFAQKVYE